MSPQHPVCRAVNAHAVPQLLRSAVLTSVHLVEVDGKTLLDLLIVEAVYSPGGLVNLVVQATEYHVGLALNPAMTVVLEFRAI